MFLLKKYIGSLLAPGTIILVLLSYGLLRLVWIGKSRRSGWIWIGAGIACFYLFSTAPLPTILLSHLEKQSEPVMQISGLKEIGYIVVLSGGVRDNPTVPPTSQLKVATALRVVEGIRLFHLLQDRPVLVMSGGDEPPNGELMKAFAGSLGVPGEKMIAETNSLDTYGNAREVKPIVKEAPFLLVTSASHMPRTLKIFQILGMNPIPAPADFWHGRMSGSALLPSGKHLTNMEAAIHEYLGLAYIKLFPRRAGG
jgi:uncharacterized SAM-binding protein YcdF (DUF218 family)